jgi:hypothetical protein
MNVPRQDLIRVRQDFISISRAPFGVFQITLCQGRKSSLQSARVLPINALEFQA